MERLTREMTFEEEYTFLKKEVKELFDKEDRKSEPPESNCVVRRALRCIKKLFAELEPYKEYKDLEEQGLLLRLPCKVGDTVWRIFTPDDYIMPCNVEEFVYSNSLYITIRELFDIRRCLNINEIGKTVFLTKAEAEQKLKEMECD